MFGRFAGRAFCAIATPVASPAFTGRVGTQTLPRSVAPVITVNVIRESKSISFECISRMAASKAVHAAAIANNKNLDTGVQALVKVELLRDDEGNREDEQLSMVKGLSKFRISMVPTPVPVVKSNHSQRARVTRVAAETDAAELAKNLHLSYMRRHPVTLQCMGDRALGVLSHAISIFNERVAAHQIWAYPLLKTMKSPEGDEIAVMQLELIEKPRGGSADKTVKETGL